jgi:hypothetical protein
MATTCSGSSFLEEVVVHLINEVGIDQLAECCILVPNRRTQVYLQEAFAAAQAQPVWSPRLFQIEDWAARLADLQPSEPLTLLLELWRVWSDLFDKSSDFHSFYRWGKIVLSDYDRLDNAMLDVAWVYGLVGDWQDLTPDPSEFFATDEEPLRQQRLDFWRSFVLSTVPSHEQTRHLFRQLHALYLAFGQRITAQGFAYKGLINRKAAERLAEIPQSLVATYYLDQPWFWIGFSDLKPAELALLRLQRNYTTVLTFWDVDSYYLNHSLHAAGRWFREAGRSELEYSQKVAPKLISDKLGELELEIQIIAAPGQVAQVKYLAQLLNHIPVDELNQTLVVLPDESLFFPLLMSLPAQVRSYNVTMGSRLVASPFFRLVDKLFEVQTRCELRDQEPYWPRDLVQALLLHPYIRRRPYLNWMETERDELYQQVSWSQLRDLPYDERLSMPLSQLFERVESDADVLPWVIATLFKLSQQLEHNTKFELPIVEREQLYEHYRRLVELRNQLQYYELELKPQLLAQVALEHLQGSLPFSGEPLGKLQIMGLRETRNLDFDRVFILSLNEGIVPSLPQLTSLIPDELAPNLGLSSWREEQDHSCYMVWRCMHRARKVTLFYSNLDYGDQPAQPSRIIDQIRYEWQLVNPNLRIISPALDISAREPDVTPPLVPSDGDLNREASLWLAERGLSVSALNNWLACRLKFSLTHLFGLQELPPLTAELEARHEGTLLHETMECLYADLIGSTAQPSDFKNLAARVESLVRVRLLTELGQPGLKLTGETHLTEKQLVRRIKEILEKDEAFAPFEVMGLEMKYECPLEINFKDQCYMIKCKGTIDRIDRLPDGSILLIDYKTGKHQAKPLHQDTTLPRVIDEVFRKRTIKNQASLDQINQALFYLWLYRRLHPEENACEFVWYSFDTLGEGRFRRKQLSDLIPDLYLDQGFFDAYEQAIIDQIHLILEQSTERHPTDQIQLCKTCDLVNLCWREVEGL